MNSSLLLAAEHKLTDTTKDNLISQGRESNEEGNARSVSNSPDVDQLAELDAQLALK